MIAIASFDLVPSTIPFAVSRVFKMASKTLNIYSLGLQRDTTVMLMFEPPSNKKLFKDQFPVVWKVITFRAKCHGKASIHYASRLAFGYAQTDADNLVDASSWVEVKAGDITRISGGPGDKRFGENTKGDGSKLLVCKNNTENRANLSIGFVKGDDIDQRYEPTLIWTGVGAGSNISAQFTPTLTAYITRDYKASQMLRGEVETDAIWSQNLNELDDVTGWNLLEDEESGQFTIVPANRV